MPRPSRYPVILSVGIDPALDACLAEAARTSGVSKAAVVRLWLRRGGVTDRPQAAPGAPAAELVKDTVDRLFDLALDLLKKAEGPAPSPHSPGETRSPPAGKGGRVPLSTNGS
jgi:hypothetical protein